MHEIDDREIDDLLRLFATKLGQGVECVELDLAASVVVMVKDGVEHRLHLPRPVVAHGLRECEDSHPWGDGVDAQEAMARFMTVHLDESMAMSPWHESRWWSYRAGGFLPAPPWETHRRG